jgi:hypothetical protein
MNKNTKLSFGEKAVGSTSDPGGNLEVETVRIDFANIIDTLDDMRTETDNPEVKRMLSLAITDAQTAQMWTVKAMTWQH